MLDTKELEIATKAVEIYASRYRRPSEVDGKQAAEMLNISYQTFAKRYLKNGRLQPLASGKYATEDIDKIIASRPAFQ